MQCTRYGCSRQLRSHNTTGVCSSNCESADAPAAARAAGVKRAPTSTSAKTVELPPSSVAGKANASAIMKRFEKVTETLGLDPEVILAEAAQGWMDGLRELISGEDEG